MYLPKAVVPGCRRHLCNSVQMEERCWYALAIRKPGPAFGLMNPPDQSAVPQDFILIYCEGATAESLFGP